MHFENRLQIGSLWLIAPQKIFWVVSKQLVFNRHFYNGGLRGKMLLDDTWWRSGEDRRGGERRHKRQDNNDTQLSGPGATLIFAFVTQIYSIIWHFYLFFFSSLSLWDVITVERRDAACLVQTRKTKTGGVYRDRGGEKWTAFPVCVR